MLISQDTRDGRRRQLRPVLAVDDDPNITMGMRVNLRAKYNIITAANGAEALAICEAQGPFPVVITDFRMPGIDGIELLEQIRVKYPQTIRMMLSGNVDMGATVRAVNDGGVQRLLLKPVEPSTLKDAIAAAFCLYEQAEQERALAYVDPLLQIGTRRAFELAAARTQALAIRHQRPYAVAMVDVDHFKRYNDAYGHVSGDAVLRQVVNAIRGTMRASDELFRYGGEEFVLILSEVSPEGAATIVERYCAAVSAQSIIHEHNQPPVVTISLGLAVGDPRECQGFLSIVKRADQALYWAKNSGRNRGRVWEPSLAVATETSPHDG